MTKKSRITLKEYFKAGEMPTQEDFKDLIDSSLNRIDDDIEVVTENGKKRFGIGTSIPEADFHVNGDFKLKEGVSVNRISRGEYLSNNNTDTLVTESAIAQFTSTITPPIGAILPWFPGCFVKTKNQEFEDLTEQIALADNWRVCDGKEVDDPESPFHGKRVPYLTQDCFLMGAGQAGTIGGTNDGTHSHQMRNHKHNWNLKNAAVGNHRHSFSDNVTREHGRSVSTSGSGANMVEDLREVSVTDYTSYNGSHNHSISGSVGTGNNVDNSEVRNHDEPLDNRPNFLSVQYIIRIK